MSDPKRRRRLLALVVSATLPVSMATTTGASAGPIKVVISQAFQSLLYLPLYVAIDGGYFAKHGVDVDKETAGTPPAALSAVISGSADFSLHGPEWTAIAASKGAKVDVVAAVVNRAAVWIAADPGFNFAGPASLKGQKVVTGMMPTTSTSLFLDLMKQSGIDATRDIDLINVPIGTEPGPFLAGQAKVAVMYEPGLDQAVSRGMKVVYGFPTAFGPYAFSSLSARTDVDPAKAERVVAAMQDALVAMRRDPTAAIVIAKKEFSKLDPKIVEAAVDRMLRENVYPDNVETTPDALSTAMQIQRSLGNLKSQPEYSSFVVQTFAKEAMEQTVKP